MIELIRQPVDSYLCQACCVAMIAGVSLQDVLNKARLTEAPDDSKKPYLTNYESAIFLWEHGFMFGCVGRWNFEQIDMSSGLAFQDVHKIPAIVGVRSEIYKDKEHAVVWCPDRQMILDPQKDEPQKITNYLVYEWIPCPKMIDPNE